MKKVCYEEEVGNLEEHLGPLNIFFSGENVRFEPGQRTVTRAQFTGEKVGIQTISLVDEVISIPGKQRRPLHVNGLLPLLILRSKRLRLLVKGMPRVISWDNMEADLYLPILVEYAILMGDDNPHYFREYLRRFPDWTLAFMFEIRATFAMRADFAPDYLLMSFRESELRRDEEIDALAGEFFPGYKWAKTKDRRAKLQSNLRRTFRGPKV